MHKLKLESLQVDTFVTAAVAPRPRGTVLGHNEAPPGTDDPAVCGGPTAFMDCTAGCSRGCTAGCPYGTYNVCS